MNEEIILWCLRAALILWCLYICRMLFKTFRGGQEPPALDDKHTQNKPPAQR